MIKYPLILLLLFFSITVGSASAIEQLTITITPTNPWVNDTITITVTSNGTPIQSAKVNFDKNFIGLTDSNGNLDHKLNTSGMHKITATTKFELEKATKSIRVLDTKLRIQCLYDKLPKRNIVIVIDDSGRKDSTTGLSYIDIIKANALDLIQNMGRDSNVGIVVEVFGGSIEKKDILPIIDGSNQAELEKFIKENGLKIGEYSTHLNKELLVAEELLNKVNGTKEIIVISDGIISKGSFEQIKKIVIDLKDKNIKIHFVQINIVQSNKPNSLYDELASLSSRKTIVLDVEERASDFIDLVQSEESSSEELCSIQINEPSMIRITLSNGAPIEDVDISFDGNTIGKTNHEGKVIFSTLRPGLHNITATKLRFGNAMKTVRVLPTKTAIPTPTQTISSTPIKLKNEVRELNEPINKKEGLKASWSDLIICRLKSILGFGCIESQPSQKTSIESSYEEAPKIYEVQTSQTPTPIETEFVGTDIEKISHELNIMNSKGWNTLAGELGQAKTATVLWYHIKTGYNMDVKMVLGEPNKLDAALAIMVSNGGKSNLPKIKIKGAEYYVIYPMTPAIVNEFNYGYIFDEPWGEDNLYAEDLRLSHTDTNKIERWMKESKMTIRYTDFTRE